MSERLKIRNWVICALLRLRGTGAGAEVTPEGKSPGVVASPDNERAFTRLANLGEFIVPAVATHPPCSQP